MSAFTLDASLLDVLTACRPREGSSFTDEDIDAAYDAVADLIEACQRSERLFRQALPKFNWGSSPLDANAILLLNLVPGEVRQALQHAGIDP